MSNVPTVLKSDRSVFDKMLPVDDNALKLFSFQNVEKRLAFSLIDQLDNDYCAVEIISRNLETNKRISKRSQNTRASEN